MFRLWQFLLLLSTARAEIFNFKGKVEGISSPVNITNKFWAITQLIDSYRQLVLEAGTTVSLSVTVEPVDIMVYVSVFNWEQWAVAQQSDYSLDSAVRQILPAYKRYEFTQSLTTSFTNEDGARTFIPALISPATNITIHYSGSIYFVSADGSKLMASDVNYFHGSLGFLIIFAVSSMIVLILFVRNKMLKYPIPMFLVGAIFFHTASLACLYANLFIINSSGFNYLALSATAFALRSTADAFIYLVAGASAMGWTLLDRQIPAREQLSYTAIVVLYFIFGCIRDAFGEDASAFIQLLMEFLRIMLGFMMSVALRATVIRCRHRAAQTNNVPQDRRMLLYLMTSYSRMEYLTKLQNWMPSYILFPTLVIFLEAYFLKMFSAWISFAFMTTLSWAFYLYLAYWMLPRIYDISGTVLSAPKYRGRREYFVPPLFLDPIWFSTEDNGLWESFAWAMHEWSMRFALLQRRPDQQAPPAANVAQPTDP